MSIYTREGKILQNVYKISLLTHVSDLRQEMKLVSFMNVVKQSNWKFGVTVEVAKLKAAEVILVYSMDKILLLAFWKFCVLLSFRMSFLPV